MTSGRSSKEKQPKEMRRLSKPKNLGFNIKATAGLAGQKEAPGNRDAEKERQSNKRIRDKAIRTPRKADIFQFYSTLARRRRRSWWPWKACCRTKPWLGRQSRHARGSCSPEDGEKTPKKAGQIQQHKKHCLEATAAGAKEKTASQTESPVLSGCCCCCVSSDEAVAAVGGKQKKS